MSICLYAMCADNGAFDLPVLKELLTAHALLTMQKEGLMLVYLEAGKLPNLTTTATQYDQIITHLSYYTTALPVRFPTLLQDLPALTHWVERNQMAIQEKLTNLAGKVEYTLLLRNTQAENDIASLPALPTTTVGKYLKQKLAEYQPIIHKENIVNAFLAQYLPIFAQNSTQHKRLAPAQPDIIWEAVFLIEISHLPAFLPILETNFDLPPTIHLAYSGPWVCYHFATL